MIVEKLKAFTHTRKDMGESSYQDFMCIKWLVFKNAKTPNETKVI